MGEKYAETFGPPGWVARPVCGVTKYADVAGAEEDDIQAVVKSSLAEIAEAEIMAIRTHTDQSGGVLVAGVAKRDGRLLHL